MNLHSSNLLTRDHLRQTTDHIMMIRPAGFGYNEQTARNNAFMIQDREHSKEEIQELAKGEFDAMVSTLRANNIRVTVIEDEPSPNTPDAVFPNNWISTHQDGKIVLYPMWAPNRRQERRADIVDWLASLYPEVEVVDLSAYELEGKFLEGTGSMIFDRVNQIVYANESPRTDRELFHLFCRKFSLEGHLFRACDEHGVDIYHTNVMMAMGTTFAVVCLDALPIETERAELQQRLAQTGHEIIPITLDQVHAFAGNMLQVYNLEGVLYTVISRRAFGSLRPDQIGQLQAHSELIVVDLDMIELCGGGSVRCMMAELFHPTDWIS